MGEGLKPGGGLNVKFYSIGVLTVKYNGILPRTPGP